MIAITQMCVLPQEEKNMVLITYMSSVILTEMLTFTLYDIQTYKKGNDTDNMQNSKSNSSLTFEKEFTQDIYKLCMYNNGILIPISNQRRGLLGTNE